MFRQLQFSSKLKMGTVIRVFWEKRCNCREIYRQFYEVFGENAPLRQAIERWCDMLKKLTNRY